MSNIVVRELLYEDLDKVTRIHIASFSDRALSQLGTGAVKRYYQFLFTDFLQSNPICAETDGNILIGFCFNGFYSGSFAGYLRKHKWYLAGYLVAHPWLIFNPIVREQSALALKTLKRMFISKFYRRPKKAIVVKKPIPESPLVYRPWGILSIAVDPAYQRQGVAEAMIRFVENMIEEIGINTLELSVHTDNYPAVRFYEKMGWQKIPAGEKWDGKMIKRID